MKYKVDYVSWQDGKHFLTQLREQVFIFEWQLPRNSEFDNLDETAIHALITDENDYPIATGRLTQDGEIGHIAVRKHYRQLVVYGLLFDALLQEAKRHSINKVFVRCDLEAVDYHKKIGFSPQGPAFMEAGIPRQKMACQTHEFSLPNVLNLH